MSSPAIRISINKPSLQGTIQLTGSKSESNRALILQALSEGQINVENLSEAEDTVTLKQKLSLETGIKNQESGTRSQEGHLESQNSEIKNQKSELKTQDSGLKTQDLRLVNVGPAGTAMRFLTAYFATRDGEIILTGSERMQQRPVGILVDALRDLGADIEYLEKDGFPPLKIRGPLQQKSDRVSVKGNISSQYISALLLIAPALPEGLTVLLEDELTSRPYVEMTLALLEQAGIRHQWDDHEISIWPQSFRPANISIEPDWSAASYWYAMAALSEEAEFFLPGLNKYSLQGDSRITEIMANFGITSQFRDGGVVLKKEEKKPERKIFDLKDCPDLAQTVIVCCAALGHSATFTGLETLKIKETDRIKALQTEVEKIGVQLIEKNLTYKLDCSRLAFPEKLSISTYEDHRMAMAFAPLALKVKELEIQDPEVVKKSYPAFWDDMKKAGFDTRYA